MEPKNEAPESFLTWKKILKSKANANLKAFFNLMLYLFKNPFINKPFPLLINIDSTVGDVKREREGDGSLSKHPGRQGGTRQSLVRQRPIKETSGRRLPREAVERVRRGTRISDFSLLTYCEFRNQLSWMSEQYVTQCHQNGVQSRRGV